MDVHKICRQAHAPADTTGTSVHNQQIPDYALIGYWNGLYSVWCRIHARKYFQQKYFNSFQPPVSRYHCTKFHTMWQLHILINWNLFQHFIWERKTVSRQICLQLIRAHWTACDVTVFCRLQAHKNQWCHQLVYTEFSDHVGQRCTKSTL